MAILLRAIRDFVNYRHAKSGTEQHKIAVDAAGWVFWEGDEREFMSFRWVCDQLDLSPEHTRRLMRSLSPRDLLHMTPPEEMSETEE